jgi:hypothetical protein
MSLAKHFNFKPKEYAAPSQGVRSKKIIRTWAHALKALKMEKQPKGEKKGGSNPAQAPQVQPQPKAEAAA